MAGERPALITHYNKRWVYVWGAISDKKSDWAREKPSAVETFATQCGQLVYYANRLLSIVPTEEIKVESKESPSPFSKSPAKTASEGLFPEYNEIFQLASLIHQVDLATASRSQLVQFRSWCAEMHELAMKVDERVNAEKKARLRAASSSRGYAMMFHPTNGRSLFHVLNPPIGREEARLTLTASILTTMANLIPLEMEVSKAFLPSAENKKPTIDELVALVAFDGNVRRCYESAIRQCGVEENNIEVVLEALVRHCAGLHEK